VRPSLKMKMRWGSKMFSNKVDYFKVAILLEMRWVSQMFFITKLMIFKSWFVKVYILCGHLSRWKWGEVLKCFFPQSWWFVKVVIYSAAIFNAGNEVSFLNVFNKVDDFKVILCGHLSCWKWGEFLKCFPTISCHLVLSF
jgi:hypothetical protein